MFNEDGFHVVDGNFQHNTTFGDTVEKNAWTDTGLSRIAGPREFNGFNTLGPNQLHVRPSWHSRPSATTVPIPAGHDVPIPGTFPRLNTNLVMHGVEVNGSHLMEHFVNHGPNTARPCLQAGHGVVFHDHVAREAYRCFKLSKVRPNPLCNSRAFFLALGRMEDQQAVHFSIIVQVKGGPVHIITNGCYSFFR